jgi:hypothetical protein
MKRIDGSTAAEHALKCVINAAAGKPVEQGVMQSM